MSLVGQRRSIAQDKTGLCGVTPQHSSHPLDGVGEPSDCMTNNRWEVDSEPITSHYDRTFLSKRNSAAKKEQKRLKSTSQFCGVGGVKALGVELGLKEVNDGIGGECDRAVGFVPWL